jgi:hypothetical protein
MPLNTRVGRCVTKLRNKYGYGKAIGICQHSTKQNYLTGKTMRKKKTRRRKKTKRGGSHVPTWIIKATPKPVAKFKRKIFNNPKYVSVEDEEAREIMNYLTAEAKDNTDDDRYFIMKYEEGLWYPGEEVSYDKAINECSNPCYQIDSTGIRHVMKRNVSHGSKHKTRRKKHKKSRRHRRK